MSYKNIFIETNYIFDKTFESLESVKDEQLKAYYVGFLTVSAITAFELSIKQILIDFSKNQNSIFGNFMENYFIRLNGRIKYDDIIKEIGNFNISYKEEFKEELKKKNRSFEVDNKDIIVSYNNLVLARHKFVHEGKINLTINEVVECYNLGKFFIECLFNTMK
jgi:hypothetical protein